MQPIDLPANQLHRFYRGGPAIAEFRGIPSEDDYAPEDWVGSATAVFGSDGFGLTQLSDGTTLAQAFDSDPEAFFGAAHAERFGGDPALLVKLLDAGQRLPVHFHPDRAFASAHLGSPYGKTEAWWILSVRSPDAAVHVGFRDDVDPATVADWVERQETNAMLAAMHRLTVSAGDPIFVPAGTAHAIGEGILIVELQEPTDFSVLLEWQGLAIDGAEHGHLGLGFERALEGLDRRPLAEQDIARLRSSRRDARPGVEKLFPAEADPFFRGERIRPRPSVELEPAFSILVVVGGAGRLKPARGEAVSLARGQTVLVPFAAGDCRLDGDLDAIRCMPPL